LNRAVELLRAEGGVLYLLDESREQVKLAAVANVPKDLEGTSLDLNNSVVGQVIRTKEPLSIPDYRHWPDRLLQFDEYGFTAVAGAPIIWQGEVWGALVVHDDVEGRVFGQEDLNLLSHFGNWTAVALENAELAARDANKLIRLEKLSQANSAIMDNLGTMSLDDRLNLIAKHAAEILDAEACGISLVKREGHLSLEASHGHSEGKFTKGKEFIIQSGPQTGLTGHIAYKAELFNKHGDELINHFAVNGKEGSHTSSGQCFSLLAIPLIRSRIEKKLIGLLRVDNKKDQQRHAGPNIGFTEEDEQILELFADAVTVAIESAELVTQLNEQKNLLNEQRDHLERVVASSPNGVVALDPTGHVTDFNSRAQEVFGYQREEMIGMSVDLLYAQPAESHVVGGRMHKSDDGKVSNIESSIRSKTGELIPIRLAATWLYDAQGAQIGSVGYFEDLRSIRETEQRLALLLKASNFVAQARDLSDGLQSLAEMLVTFLNATFCSIFLLDENQQNLITKAAYPGPNNQFDWKPRLEETTAVADWLGLSDFLHNSDPLVLRITGRRSKPLLLEWAQRFGLSSEIQSLLITPLRTRDHPVGLLALGDLWHRERTPFSSETKQLAAAIADQTAILIDRMQLHEITEHRQQLLTALDEASRHIRAEKETTKLLQEVVRLAAELVGCEIGGLYINRPQLGELELRVTYGLSSEVPEVRQPHSEGIVGIVARTGKAQLIQNYARWPEQEAILKPFNFQTVAAIPLHHHLGEVEAVLFVADRTGSRHLIEADLEILGRFAAQASIALQTSQLLGQEQRTLSQLAILHRISNYIQAAGDLDRILHVVLTGVTAGYGLGFNRAALLLPDESRQMLEGKMGIGHLDERTARMSWRRDHKQGTYDFGRYLDLLEQDVLPPTPLAHTIRKLQLPLLQSATDIFSRTMAEGHLTIVEQIGLDTLPPDFIEAFQPGLPLIVVPLRTRGQAIGLLVADNKFTRAPITQEDEEALLTFANTAAIAIDKTQLFRETEVAHEHLRAFYKASSAVVSSQDPETVLRDIVERAREAANASGVILLLIDQQGQGQRQIIAGSKKHFDLLKILHPDGISVEVMRSGKPQTFGNTTVKLPPKAHPSVFWDNVSAALCLPMSLEGKGIGVMWLHYDQPRHFAESELDALQLYVNQAAITYNSARRARAMEALYEASQAVTGSLHQDEILNHIAHQAWRLSDHRDPEASFASIRLVEGTIVRLVTTYPPEKLQEAAAKGWQEINLLVGRGDKIGVTGRVIKTGEPQIVGDVSKDPDYLKVHPNTRSELAVPMKIEGNVIGTISVEHSHLNAFDEEDQRAQEALAAQAAIAIRNARQFEALKELDRKKSDFVSTVSHDLRAPLALVMMCVENILGNRYGPLSDQQRQWLDTALAATRHESQLIENLLDLARIQVGRAILDLKHGSVSQIIEEVVVMFNYDANQREIKLVKELPRKDRLQMQMDVSKIKQVITNLISNSLKFTRAGGTVTIKAARRKREILVEITDTGIGIPPEMATKIFEPFYRVDSPFTHHIGGTGIGLSIAKSFVEIHGGQLSVKSEVDNGSTFLFTLPMQG
jgi:PAS domain S-box-containing protein